MANNKNDNQMEAYSQAVKSGMYAKRAGLRNKYDNVRYYWEDEITREFLRKPLHKLVDRARAEMRQLRIMDLGFGSADGYELLKGVQHRNASLKDDEVDLLTPEILGLYKGVDLSKDLLEQARGIYGDNPKMKFELCNFAEDFPVAKKEKPYDLYFTSYGTCSHHNEDETMVKLLKNIAENVQKYALVMCDWIGRFSFEWQNFWTNDFSKKPNMDYIVSYIYDKDERERRREELQHLKLRLMSRSEAENIVSQASKQAGVKITPLTFFDRSAFVGRHIETGEYNSYPQSTRLVVNSLHEANMRTDLESLVFDYVPKEGFQEVNDYFEQTQMCWNTLVHYVIELLESYNQKDGEFTSKIPPINPAYPKPLYDMMKRMRGVIEGVGWLGIGLPRENIIEPQLGYALRHLEKTLQQGYGCAHNLVGIFEIDKT